MLETRNGPLVLHSFLNPHQPQARARSHNPDSHIALLEETRGALRPLSASTDADTEVGEGYDDGSDKSVVEITGRDERTLITGLHIGKDTETGDADDNEEEAVSLAPLLIGTIVAPARENMREARKAAADLERIGVRFQRQWVKEQQAGRHTVEGEQDDG